MLLYDNVSYDSLTKWNLALGDVGGILEKRVLKWPFIGDTMKETLHVHCSGFLEDRD